MNGLMKSLSMVIYTYFKMQQPTSIVKFINATNKLKCHHVDPFPKSISYSEKKKLAKKTTRKYLEIMFPDKIDWLINKKRLMIFQMLFCISCTQLRMKKYNFITLIIRQDEYEKDARN